MKVDWSLETLSHSLCSAHKQLDKNRRSRRDEDGRRTDSYMKGGRQGGQAEGRTGGTGAAGRKSIDFNQESNQREGGSNEGNVNIGGVRRKGGERVIARGRGETR